MKFSEIKGFIFDFDGTLIDSHPALVGPFTKGINAVGYECTPELVAREMHFALRQMVQHLGMSEEEGIKCAAIIREEIRNPEEWKKSVPFADVIPFLEALKANGKRIGILSGARDYHIRDVLEFCNMLHYFDFIVGGSLDRPTKPHPAGMYICLDFWPELNKSEVVYIGDSLQDPECAHNAGIHGCLIDRNNTFPTYKGTKVSNLLDLIKE